MVKRNFLNIGLRKLFLGLRLGGNVEVGEAGWVGAPVGVPPRGD